jgi:polysaccharide chain length determinant protein (PEP-CTERM system associated)
MNAPAHGAPRRPRQKEILEYLEVPLRHPRWVIVPFVVILVGAVAAALLMPKMYLSQTLILVESEKVPEGFLTRITTETSAKRMNTIRQEILSRTRLQTVIRELDPYGDLGKTPMSQLVERMQATIRINLRGGGDAFTVGYVHRDPRLAQAVAHRLTTLFIEEATRDREQRVTETYQFIDQQLAEARREIESREQNLRSFKEKHMGTLPEQVPTHIASLQGIRIEQQTLSQALREAIQRLNQLESAPGPAAAAARQPDSELNQLRAQLAALKERYTDEHPDVKVLTARVARLERSLASVAGPETTVSAEGLAHRARVEEARLEVERLRARETQLGQQLAGLQGKVDQAPRTEQELATLTRDFDKLNENYYNLLNKKLDAAMASKLEQRWKGEQFRILDPANLPEHPFRPNRPVILGVGAFFGLVCGLGAAFLVDFLNHSVRSLSELEAALSFPVLATLSFIEEDKGPGPPRPKGRRRHSTSRPGGTRPASAPGKPPVTGPATA